MQTGNDAADADVGRKRVTMTKVLVPALLMTGVIGGFLPYILSALDKEPVSEMGVAWVTEIVAVIIGYLCKSYFETKQEAVQALEDYKAGKTAAEEAAG